MDRAGRDTGVDLEARVDEEEDVDDPLEQPDAVRIRLARAREPERRHRRRVDDHAEEQHRPHLAEPLVRHDQRQPALLRGGAVGRRAVGDGRRRRRRRLGAARLSRGGAVGGGRHRGGRSASAAVAAAARRTVDGALPGDRIRATVAAGLVRAQPRCCTRRLACFDKPLGGWSEPRSSAFVGLPRSRPLVGHRYTHGDACHDVKFCQCSQNCESTKTVKCHII